MVWYGMVGKLKRGRYAHAAVEANLDAVFAASGNLDPVDKKGKYITKAFILKAQAPTSIGLRRCNTILIVAINSNIYS